MARTANRVGNGTPREAGIVLIVEDDANDILLVRRAFKKLNILNQFQVVRDGEEAVNYLSGKGTFADRHSYPLPVLVLLDLKLPRMSGLEVLKWIRSRDGLKRLPVVVLTSSNQSSDINRAYDLGVSSYIVKPVDFEVLVDLLTHVGIYWLMVNHPPEVISERPK